MYCPPEPTDWPIGILLAVMLAVCVGLTYFNDTEIKPPDNYAFNVGELVTFKIDSSKACMTTYRSKDLYGNHYYYVRCGAADDLKEFRVEEFELEPQKRS